MSEIKTNNDSAVNTQQSDAPYEEVPKKGIKGWFSNLDPISKILVVLPIAAIGLAVVIGILSAFLS